MLLRFVSLLENFYYFNFFKKVSRILDFSILINTVNAVLTGRYVSERSFKNAKILLTICFADPVSP